MLIFFIIKQTVATNTSRAVETIHGSARWAGRKDIEEAGFLKDEGVFIGGWKDGGKQERVIIFVLRETFIFWPLLPRAQEKGFALFYPLC